ncbi:hypothetical protein [Nannocystis bainbridge]|uniref:Lipoprotein n=1 Tax=Nannocystis bainbridge TaxID=2995303 RepID=A0ABT5E494_9BACT|nr:hypothetical protein [Nannocystis bainbridge]MDC0720683.1 hypothetical protein [Nannocystis bainbridge]
MAGLLVVGGGCRDRERPPIVWAGEHVQVGTDLDLDAWCPGTLTLLDSHTALLKEMFDAPADHVVTYYLYPSPISDRICPKPSTACYLPDEGAAVTTDLFNLHEIVHAVQWAHGGMPHVFDEGAATYWGGRGHGAGAEDARGLQFRSLIDNAWSEGLGSRGYWLAAKFTSYLIHANGLESYVALLKATSWDQSRANFEKTFDQAMGMTLDDAISDYEAELEWWYCDAPATQYWFHGCAQPGDVLPTGETTHFDLDISCADPEVVGPSSHASPDGTLRIWRDITLELTSTDQFITFDAPQDGEPSTVLVELKPCTTDCSLALTETVRLNPGPDGTEFSPSVLPGRYVLRVSRAAEDPGPVQIRWLQAGS